MMFEIAENPAKWGKSDSSREYNNNGSSQHKAAILAEPEHACPEILEFANRYLADIGEHDAAAIRRYLCPSLGVQKARVYKLAAEEKTTESSQVIRTVNSILGILATGWWLPVTAATAFIN
ncbi:hypothetical protein [Chromatium okenii]|uniref:Uncharacterized protein n=1 Tax=Chromatium okenii TaxID=61644 RepID=A0A2S7XTF3_9GAMM|nr:hypothetical protein [Chromatium okenii]PQJ96813.1 hypothetical protein CXB77_05570 [Chromatium okenii]